MDVGVLSIKDDVEISGTTSEDHDDLDQQTALKTATWERVAVALLVLADFAFTATNSRHWWFTADFWQFAAREGSGAWFGSHGGHLNIFNVAIADLVVLDGFDYWPVWGTVRSLFSTVIGLSAWLSLRRAGARPLLALGGTLIIVTFWYDVFITVVLVNIPITLTCMALLSHLVVSGHKKRVLAVSTLGVAAGSTMVLALVAMALVIARRPTHRALLPWLLGPLVPYAIWRLLQPPTGAGGDLWNQTDVSATLWSIAEGGVRTFLAGLPVPALVVSLLTAILLLRQTVRLFGPTDLGVHEEYFTLALGLFFLALFRERVQAGFPGTAPRYGYHITYLLVMAVIPSFKFEKTNRNLRTAIEVAVLGVLVTIPVLQLDRREQSYAYGENLGALVQTRVLAAGHLLKNGAEYYGDQNYLPGPQGGGQLQVGDLVRYLESGWDPQRPGPVDLDRAQADLITALRQVPAQESNCDRPLETVRLTEETAIVVTGEPNGELTMEWSGGAFTAPTILVERLPATGAAEIRLKASEINGVTVLLGQDQRLCNR